MFVQATIGRNVRAGEMGGGSPMSTFAWAVFRGDVVDAFEQFAAESGVEWVVEQHTEVVVPGGEGGWVFGSDEESAHVSMYLESPRRLLMSGSVTKALRALEGRLADLAEEHDQEEIFFLVVWEDDGFSKMVKASNDSLRWTGSRYALPLPDVEEESDPHVVAYDALRSGFDSDPLRGDASTRFKFLSDPVEERLAKMADFFDGVMRDLKAVGVPEDVGGDADVLDWDEVEGDEWEDYTLDRPRGLGSSPLFGFTVGELLSKARERAGEEGVRVAQSLADEFGLGLDDGFTVVRGTE